MRAPKPLPKKMSKKRLPKVGMGAIPKAEPLLEPDGIPYSHITVEERLKIYKRWVESSGAISYMQLGKEFNRDRRTIQGVISGEHAREKAEQEQAIYIDGEPDLKQLRTIAWFHITREVYGGNIAVCKMIINGDLKMIEKNAMKKKDDGRETAKEAAEAFQE